MLNIFVLKWEFDTVEHYFFQGSGGQTEEDFNRACSRMLDNAVLNAIDSSKRSDEDSYVGWNDIVKELSKLLPGEGFYEFAPATVTFDGPPVIAELEEMAASPLGSKTKNLVLEYNKTIDKKYGVHERDPDEETEFEESMNGDDEDN